MIRLRRHATVAASLAVLLAACTTRPAASPVPSPAKSLPAAPSTASPSSAEAVRASLAPWHLPAPVSRTVALAQPDGHLLLLGGLAADGASADGIFDVDPATGATTKRATLVAPTHDAGGAMLSGRAFLFGGGESKTVDTVQSFATGQKAAVVAGHLPSPRSDLTVTTANGTAYVAGGYDGSTLSPAVWSTTDGTHFEKVGSLATPVRYAAAAISGDTLYVFGGTNGSREIATIQSLDLRGSVMQTSQSAGTMPFAVAHASAATIGNAIYVAGGRRGNGGVTAIVRYDPATRSTAVVAALPAPVSDAAIAQTGDTTWLVGGEGARGEPTSRVVALRVSAIDPPASASPAPAAPFEGSLLIADRGNNRLLLVDAAKHVLWQYPSKTAAAPPGGFYFPDDAFFTRGGTAIISNQEENHTIVEIAYPSGKVLWQYGHPRHPGASAGYLNQPDDVYVLKDGTVTVADAKNCRILFLTPRHTVDHQIGRTGDCSPHPPRTIGYPNGDTPLQDGNLLVSEIVGHAIDEITVGGRLVWRRVLPFRYPSDPQQVGPDRYLVAAYTRPGGLYIVDRAGHVYWKYTIASGDGMLDHPSLAVQLPTGLIAVNDDYRHRVALIDPHTRSIVWQYGVTGRKGSARGLLNTPDGMDLLAPDGSYPLHPWTG